MIKGNLKKCLGLILVVGLGGQALADNTLYEFGVNGATSDPNDLADHLITPDTGIVRNGDAEFQGNWGDSGGGGSDSGDEGSDSGDEGSDLQGIWACIGCIDEELNFTFSSNFTVLTGSENGTGSEGDGYGENGFEGNGDESSLYGGDGETGEQQTVGSAAYFTDLNLDLDDPDQTFAMPGGGILLTSGVGTPPDSNTSGSYTGFASGMGDAGLNELLEAAELNASTWDATVLSFGFDLAEGYNGIHFNYLFATEEFPNWSDYNDVAAVFVDGRNVTVFPDGSGLIVNNHSLNSLLFDNDPWGPGEPGDPGADPATNDLELPIEYDGLTGRMGISVPLEPGTHHIKIAVSDAGDPVYDTGFFVSDLRGVVIDPAGEHGGSGSGVSESDPVLPPANDDPSDGFDLTVTVGDSGIGIDPTTPLWIDPEVAIGYIYEVTDTTFATLTLPAGSFGDGLFDVSWWTGSVFNLLGTFNSGDLVNFLTLVGPGGVSQFKITGIEPSAAVDPTDPLGFPVGVTFTSGGTHNIKMTPITQNVQNVPEPPAWLLLLAPALLVLVRKRQAIA